ncbi:MAG: c-type cytochrome [Desulfonatronovibrionaceae bacterium]
MRKVQLKQTTIGTIIVIFVSIIALAGLRSRVTADMPPDEGATLFKSKGCASCHLTDSQETKSGPGLKGLFDREDLPKSGRPLTTENVHNQIIDPHENMPSFENQLTKEQIEAIVGYLKTL